MKTFLRNVLIICFLGISYLGFAQGKGKLSGFVKDANTQEALIGVTVLVEGTTLGGTTNIDGYYLIENIPAKTYSLSASFVGYKKSIQYDVIVSSGNTGNVNFRLEEVANELQEVEIVVNNSPTSIESPTSVQRLGAQEIKTYPGGNNDIAKVVQSLPGVSGSVGFRNDIIIRGGAPNENVYYLDGIEIPNINHFATQGAAGGPVGMLNVNFIEDVTLSTSAFHSRYDNPLSGILQFAQRIGNRDQTRYSLRVGASEFAGTVEGKILKNKPNLTYIASVRRSYLQFLFKLIDLPFLPSYWDYQYKVNWKIDQKNEISLIGLGSIDDFAYNPPQNATLEQLAILDNIALQKQYTNTIGLQWKRLIDNGYLQMALSNNILDNRSDKFDDNDDGNEAKRRTRYRSEEHETKLRLEVSKLVNGWKYSYGFNAQYNWYTNSTFDRITATEARRYETDLSFLRYGAFVQASKSFGKLSISGGLRTDMNSFTDEGTNPLNTLSPRLSLSYALTDKLNFNASVGKYYKIAPYTILGYRNNAQEYVNRDAKYIGSLHYVAGFEFLPSQSTRITLEGFYKKYDNYPVSVRDSISLANLGGNFGILGNEDIKSVGLGQTYGFELMLQKRLTKNFFGILAYTFYYSEYTGFDQSKYTPSAWDNRHLVSFTGGYRLGRNWEISLRYRFQQGAPYTPYNDRASAENYAALGRGILDYSRLNSVRLGSFQSADLRIDKKWNFNKWALNLFLDIQNVLNSLNPTPPTYTLKRNADNSYTTADGSAFNGKNGIPVIIPNTSGSRLPTIGANIEF